MCVWVCVCVWVVYSHVSRFLTFPVFPSKGWRVNSARKPKQPPCSPRCLCVRLQSASICLLYGSEPCSLCVCVCVCVCVCNQAPVCFPYGSSSPLIMDFWMTNIHCMDYRLSLSWKHRQTHTHTHTHKYQVISTVRLGSYQRSIAGRVKSTLASAAQCTVCYCCVCVCDEWGREKFRDY